MFRSTTGIRSSVQPSRVLGQQLVDAVPVRLDAADQFHGVLGDRRVGLDGALASTSSTGSPRSSASNRMSRARLRALLRHGHAVSQAMRARAAGHARPR